MKNLKLKSALFVLFLATAITSCSNDDDNSTPEVKSKVAFVTAVSGPETGKTNTELSYEVTFILDNACGEFNKISETKIGEVTGLQVEAKYPSAVCTKQVPEPAKTVYKFKSAEKGTFEIKFRKSETEFITTKVVID